MKPGTLLRLKKNQGMSYVYDYDGFAMGGESGIIREGHSFHILLLEMDMMKNTTFCKVLIGDRNMVGYIRYDLFEALP